MVVTHGARAKQLFTLLQGRLTRGRVVTRQGERAECERAEERDARLAAYLHDLFRVCKGLCSSSCQSVELRPKCQRFGFKAPRAELLRQCQGGLRVPNCRLEFHQRVPAEECRVMTNHLRPAMSHSCRSRDCLVGDRERTFG